MGSLRAVLERLQQELPGKNEVDEETIGEIGWEIDDVLGFGVHIVACDDGTSSSLPPNLRSYFDALRYVQCISGFLGGVAGDGFLALFYNGTGEDIDLLRSELMYFNDPLSPIVEKAYKLLAPVYQFEAKTNFVGRKSDADVFEVIPESTLKSVSELEDKVEALHDKTYEKALTIYKKAVGAL